MSASKPLRQLEEQYEAAKTTLQLIEAVCRNANPEESSLAEDIRAHVRAFQNVVSSPAKEPS